MSLKNEEARAFSYLFLSKLLLCPDQESAALFQSNPLEKLQSALACLPYPISLKKSQGTKNGKIEVEKLKLAYNRLFEHKTESPLSEYTYIKKNSPDITQVLADIASFYRAFGLRAEGKERHDHIATELEFMGFAVERQCSAEKEKKEEEKEICLEIEKRFFQDHLSRFYPEVAHFLKNCSSPFYKKVGDYLACFCNGEKSYLGFSK